MSFRILKGSTCQGVVFDLSFFVMSHGEEGLRLRLSIHRQIMEKMGWNDATRLQLLVDEEEGKGQLLAVAKAGRKMKVPGLAGHGQCHFTYTFDEAKFFSQYDDACDLTIVEADPDNGSLTFELPPVAEEQSEVEGTEEP